jgi:L-ascorbate metabolism protein UlaG (beta-lactamase superfamily)
MKLTWLGHSCFLVETAEGSAVLDPYAPGSVPGLALPELTADLVLCSHGHRDHGYREAVQLSGRSPALKVETLESFHDEAGGALRGPNTIHILQAEGLRLAHLGDLGHMLTPAQLAALGRIDVLLIPVGGHYTIGPETAAALADAVGAGITVPMHYRGPGFGYSVIGPAEDFLRLRGRVQRLESNVLRPEALQPPVTAVLRCPLRG